MIKILYIDDEEANRELFELNLMGSFDVVTAESASEGLEILNSSPDIKYVFTDMKMPRMSGIEFISEAKPKFPDKKYFVISGFEVNAEIQQALDSGLIDSYFPKSYNFSEFEDKLLEMIKGKP